MDIVNDEIQSVKASIVAVGDDIKIIKNEIKAIDNGTVSSSSSDSTNLARRNRLEQDKSSLQAKDNILQAQLAELFKRLPLPQSNNQGKNSLYLSVFTYTIISFMLYLSCNYSTYHVDIFTFSFDLSFLYFVAVVVSHLLCCI